MADSFPRPREVAQTSFLEGASNDPSRPLVALPSTPTLRLAGSLTVERTLKALWSHSARASDEWAHPLILDLSECTGIDIASTCLLLANFQARQEAGCPTSIRFPQDRKLRDVLREWRFQSAFEAIMGISLESATDTRDRGYFGESVNDSAIQEELLPPMLGSIRTMEAEGVFCLTVHSDALGEFAGRLIPEAHRRWSDPLVVGVLKTLLRGPAEDLSRVVIFESLANACQHPNAQTIVYGAQVCYADKGRTTPESLLVCVWDNGNGVSDTLRECLSNGISLRPGGALQFAEEIFSVSLSTPMGDWVRQLSSTHTPAEPVENWELLVSSLFPGVTRKGGASVQSIDMSDISTGGGETQTEPGMGLFALLRSAVDSFQGQIEFVTSNFWMNVRRTNARDTQGKGSRYRVRLRELPELNRAFHGNLLYVRLPMR